jgi:hypothetical protein
MSARRKKRKRVRRRGKAFTLYLPEKQARELSEVSRSRHVAKAEVVRVAVDRLMSDLQGGQLELPLGLADKEE